MSKVGGLDENYPLTKFLCPLDDILRLDSGLAQANFVSFGPVPGGPKFPLEMGMRQAPAGAPRREEPMAVELLKIGSLHQMLWP